MMGGEARDQLVDAYLAGAIQRRTFVRGLTALGVSAGVAAAYAVALRPGPATVAADDLDDYYSDPNTKKKKRKLKRRRRKCRQHRGRRCPR
jgi:hypothetical protein